MSDVGATTTSVAEMPAALAAALNAGDLESALALFAPEAIVVPTSPTSEPVSTPEGRRELFDTMIRRATTIEFDVASVHEVGDIGLVTGTWSWRGRARGAAVAEMSGRFADVFQREPDGSWLYVVNNPIGAA